MPLKSDITLNYSAFDRNSISSETSDFNSKLIELGQSTPLWYEVGAQEYRRRRWDGETPLPKPRVIKRGKKINIPSREKGRDIPCRLMLPDNASNTENVRGVFMHIHGGGWVLQSEEYQDPLLDQLANAANLAVLSIGYRLAPEDPFPAGPEDCYDSAEWLAENAKARFGAELKFMGGESAGGHLAVLTSLHLLRTQPTFQLSGGLLLSYGCYDLSLLPSARNFSKPLVLSPQIMAAYMEAFLPGLSHEQRRHPSISPMFADLGLAIQGVGPEGKQKQLPAALFICGTEDCLLDDTLMMGIKWLSSGGEAVVKIMPGAPHGFTLFETSQVGVSAEAAVVVKEWLGERLE